MSGRIKTERQVRLPVIGKIKCGYKTDAGYPKSCDWFIPDGKYKELFTRAFGDKPQKIEISFLSDNEVESCFERYENRQGSKLYAYGDGETFYVWDSKKESYEVFTKQKYPNIMQRIVKTTGNEWSSVLTLRFFILNLRKVFGCWQLTTRAEASSIPQIISVFDIVKQQAGTIVNVPFDLIVEQVVSQKPNSKSKYPVIKLVPNISHGHLAMVHDMIESGMQLNKLLTEENIESNMKLIGGSNEKK